MYLSYILLMVCIKFIVMECSAIWVFYSILLLFVISSVFNVCVCVL